MDVLARKFLRKAADSLKQANNAIERGDITSALKQCSNALHYTYKGASEKGQGGWALQQEKDIIHQGPPETVEEARQFISACEDFTEEAKDRDDESIDTRSTFDSLPPL